MIRIEIEKFLNFLNIYIKVLFRISIFWINNINWMKYETWIFEKNYNINEIIDEWKNQSSQKQVFVVKLK